MGRRVPDADRLTVLYSFPNAFGSAGVGWTAWNQVNELVRAGHRVHLVTTSVSRPVAGLASLRTTLSLPGVRIPLRALGHLRSFAWHDAGVAGLLTRLQPDVVHVWPGSGLRTMRAASTVGTPVVRECPNTHTGHAYQVVANEYARLGLTPPPGAAHTADPARLAIEQQEWDAASGLLVPSEVVADTFRARGYAEDRLLRHRYGCSVVEPVVRPRDARPFTAVFLGRCDPRKGLHYALRAWRQATSNGVAGRFLIYGEFDPAYRALLANDLAQPGVEIRGFTSDPLGVLASSDVLLLPTVEEGSALVTYEAQVAGCVPLVSTAAGALLEHDQQGLLHAPGDVGTIADQLRDLSTNPAALGRLRRAALAHATELSWATAGESLVSAYRQAIGPAEEVPTAADFSVVVCTRDRPAMLKTALLEITRNSSADADVIVVDSGSVTGETRSAALSAGCRYVRSDQPGLSIARNLGLRHAERRFVVFTDDDCRATPGWEDVLIRHFADPRVGVVTGELRHEGLGVPTTQGARTITSTPHGLDAGHGAIMAFRRAKTVKLGGFDPVLGAGRTLAGAEDLDMFCRHLASGDRVVHDPACAVVHLNTRAGEDYTRLLRGYGLGLGALANKGVRSRSRDGWAIALIIFRRAVRNALRSGGLRSERHGRRALLSGVFSGYRIAARIRLADSVFEDANPPRPVPMATSAGTR